METWIRNYESGKYLESINFFNFFRSFVSFSDFMTCATEYACTMHLRHVCHTVHLVICAPCVLAMCAPCILTMCALVILVHVVMCVPISTMHGCYSRTQLKGHSRQRGIVARSLKFPQVGLYRLCHLNGVAICRCVAWKKNINEIMMI